jgi:hypothetical protein
MRRIQESEVKDALKRINGGKAMGLGEIPIEVWRTLGDVAIVWLTKLFNFMFQSNKMPKEWRRSILVPIFKNKGDVQSCTNYRGIKFMSHTMRIIEHRLRRVTTQRHQKPIWFYAREIDYGGDFLDKVTYREM